MRYAIIDEGKVSNTVVADSDFAASQGWVVATEAAIGDLWDGVVFTQPTINLATLKSTKNTQINLWRAEANQTTFPYTGKLIACDQLSRSDIDGVAGSISLTGNLPAGWQGAWKAVDNTYIALPDVAAFKAMYNAMINQGSANFAKAQQLKASLAVATTQAEVDAIGW